LGERPQSPLNDTCGIGCAFISECFCDMTFPHFAKKPFGVNQKMKMWTSCPQVNFTSRQVVGKYFFRTTLPTVLKEQEIYGRIILSKIEYGFLNILRDFVPALFVYIV